MEMRTLFTGSKNISKSTKTSNLFGVMMRRSILIAALLLSIFLSVTVVLSSPIEPVEIREALTAGCVLQKHISIDTEKPLYVTVEIIPDSEGIIVTVPSIVEDDFILTIETSMLLKPDVYTIRVVFHTEGITQVHATGTVHYVEPVEPEQSQEHPDEPSPEPEQPEPEVKEEQVQPFPFFILVIVGFLVLLILFILLRMKKKEEPK